MKIILFSLAFVGLSNAECNNYVQTDSYSSYLYPVGQCYQKYNYAVSSNSNIMWKCENDVISGGLKAVEYYVGKDCDTSSPKTTGREEACNGPSKNDTCACVIGGDASECTFYEYTYYSWNWFGETDCDKTEWRTTKYVTDVCVVRYDYSYSDRSTWYACDGYDYNYGDTKYNLVCKDATQSPTRSPITTTVIPTKSPTEKPTPSPTNTEITTTYNPFNCGEEECNGVQGPRAGAKTYSVLFAVVAVFINALNQ